MGVFKINDFVLRRVLKNRKKKEVQFVKPTLVEPEFRENVMLPRFTTHSVKMAIGRCYSFIELT